LSRFTTNAFTGKLPQFVIGIFGNNLGSPAVYGLGLFGKSACCIIGII